jgi:type 1 glutamine amidotransferase
MLQAAKASAYQCWKLSDVSVVSGRLCSEADDQSIKIVPSKRAAPAARSGRWLTNQFTAVRPLFFHTLQKQTVHTARSLALSPQMTHSAQIRLKPPIGEYSVITNFVRSLIMMPFLTGIAVAQPDTAFFDRSIMDPVELASALVGKFEYDLTPPVLPAELDSPAILVFTKTNGFRDQEAITASTEALSKIAGQEGWSIFFTENGAVFNEEQLAKFDAVVWANTAGDNLDGAQRLAFRSYIESGGGFVGIHGAGGDFLYLWPWYVTQLIGAQFIGHPWLPHLQQATIRVEERSHPATRHLGRTWTRTDEWYSFQFSPRGRVRVLASVDEDSYEPVNMFEESIVMGDHPIVWERCVGNGRAFYSALGHTPQSYVETDFVKMLTGAIAWAAGLDGMRCVAGQEKARAP